METPYESEAQAVRRDPRAQIREAAPRAPVPTSGERLTRRSRRVDPLYFDKSIVPPGMSYEYKRTSSAGQPDSVHLIDLRENHWREVPAARHPELAMKGDTNIRRGDVVLMERPKYLTEEAQMENLQEALAPVQNLEEIMFGTRPDELTRDHPSVRRIATVRQQYAPGEPINEGGGLSSDP